MPQPARLRATVEDIFDHAAGLRSLVLKPERPAPRFRPGQFLHLAVDEWDPSRHWPESRPFSLASPPESRDRLQITVSEVGPYTRRIMETKPGDTVWVKLPYGEFIVESLDTTPAILVAGGTGVAPFVSLAASSVQLKGPIQLLYGVRRPDLLIYRDALDKAARDKKRFIWRPFVEHGDAGDATRGSLSVDAVFEAAESMGARSAAVIYLSGPPPMIESLTAELRRAGVSSDRVRVDAWT